MFQSKIPTNFWSYAIKHAIFLINCIPSLIISYKTPFELLYKTHPDFSMIKVFGCLCYASTHNQTHKFQPHSRKGAFLGFQNGSKGYVVLDINTREIFISKNVIFHESFFPFHTNQNLSTSEAQPHSHIDPISHTLHIDPISYTLPTPPQFTPSTPITTNTEPTIPQPNGSPSPFPNPSTPPTIDTPNPNIIDRHIQELSSNHALPRPSNRDTHPPSYLSDYQFQIPSLKYAKSSSTCTNPPIFMKL